MSDTRLYRDCVRVIIRKGNKVLLGKRLYHNDKVRSYEFPGGGVKKDETHEQAVIRECLEEVGVKVKNIKPLDIIVKHDIRYYDQVRASKYRGGIDTWYVAEFESIDHSLHGLERDPLPFVWLSVADAVDEIKLLAEEHNKRRNSSSNGLTYTNYNTIRIEALEASRKVIPVQ